jgi:trimethylamine---corrinoid protein Co-methyltransferase
MRAGTFKVLSESDVERIHAAGLSLLENPGIRCEPESILEVFRKGGARVDPDTRMVHLDRLIVDDALKSAPKSFVVHGRDPEMDLRAESGKVYFGMGGSSEPGFYDFAEGRPRRPAKSDMEDCTRIGHALPNMDFMMTLCTSGDKPSGTCFYHDMHALLRNTTKPIVFSVLDREYTSRLIEMGIAASGGESEFRARPSITSFVTPVSPLIFPKINEGIIDCVQWNMPILYAPGPMMGSTGPVTLAGLLSQTVAEVLFGLVLVQLLKKGAPVIFKMDSDVMDQSTGQCTYGSPDQILGRAALAQIGEFYKIPTFTMGGGVESKLPDSEAAAEATMGMLVNAMAGITFSQCQGTMASGLYGSVEQLVICNEIVDMIRHVLKGISITDETLALDVIRKVGPGGNFLVEDHTLQHFREELFFPRLFRRQSVDHWLEKGAQPIVNFAHDRVEAILQAAAPALLTNEADRALSAALDRALAGAAAVEAQSSRR